MLRENCYCKPKDFFPLFSSLSRAADWTQSTSIYVRVLTSFRFFYRLLHLETHLDLMKIYSLSFNIVSCLARSIHTLEFGISDSLPLELSTLISLNLFPVGLVSFEIVCIAHIDCTASSIYIVVTMKSA